MSTRTLKELRKELRSRRDREPGQAPTAAAVVVGIALALLAIAAALPIFSRPPKLVALGMIVVAIAWASLLVLALRTAHAAAQVRLAERSDRARGGRKQQGLEGDALEEEAFAEVVFDDEAFEREALEREEAPEQDVVGQETLERERLERERLERERLERDATLGRARRLTESSFLAGSNALMDVRALLRGVQDWRQRLSEAGHAPPEGGEDPSAVSIVQVFDCLLADLERLADCARALRPLADAGAAAAGLENLGWIGSTANSGSAAGEGPANGGPAAGGEILAGSKVGPGAQTTAREEIASRIAAFRGNSHPRPPSSGAGGHNNRQLLAALKLRAVAAELDHGLLGLRAGVSVLQRARLTRSSVKGEPDQRRRAADAWPRALERLEAQATELAEKVARFTRDSEHLSRELDQLR